MADINKITLPNGDAYTFEDKNGRQKTADLIAVSDVAPSSPDNKLWIKTSGSRGVLVPTVEEALALGIEGASVGQIPKIASVGNSGEPTTWTVTNYNPDAKTSDMVKPIGVDANGKLWTDISDPATIASATEDWLDENVAQETGYVIDNSLTISGAAADAKKTGDEVGDLKSHLDFLDDVGTQQTSTEESLTQGTAYQNLTMISGLYIPHGTKIFVKVKSNSAALVTLTANSHGGLNGDRTNRAVKNINTFNKWTEVTLSSKTLVAEYDPIIVALGIDISSANVTSSGTVQLEIAYGLYKEVDDLSLNVTEMNADTDALNINTFPTQQTNANISVSANYCWQYINYDFKAGQKYRVHTNISGYNGELVRILSLSIETTNDKTSNYRVDTVWNNPLDSDGTCEFTASADAKTLRIAVASSNSRTIATTIETLLVKRVSDLEDNSTELSGRIGALENTVGELSDTELVPDYYKTHLADALVGIHELERQIGYGGCQYIFITDTHVADNSAKSPALLRALLKSTISNFVIFGGDLVKNYGTVDSMYEQVYKWRDLWEDACEDHPLYTVRGNHDITIRLSAQVDEGITCSKPSVYSMLLRKNEDHFFLADETRPLYYYFDDVKQKVRYIVLDSTERSPDESDLDMPWHNGLGISSAQLNWMITRVKELESGWHVIICPHIGMTNNVLSVDQDPLNYYAPILGTIEAMALKKAYVYSGSPMSIPTYVYNINEDFTNLSADVLYVRNGHDHRDNYDYTGVWEIGSIADARYPYTDSHTGNTHARTIGTIDEQAIDVDTVDFANEILYCRRIGSGYNRTFHLAPVGAGTLTPTISGDSFTWKSINTDVCTVSGGVVTAVATGYTAVEAMSNDTGDKELWAIHIS